MTRKENFSETQLHWLKLLRSKNIIKSRDRQSGKVFTTNMTKLHFLPQKELILGELGSSVGVPTKLGPALCFTLETPHPAVPTGLLNPLYKWPVTQRVQLLSPKPSEPEWGDMAPSQTGPESPRALGHSSSRSVRTVQENKDKELMSRWKNVQPRYVRPACESHRARPLLTSGIGKTNSRKVSHCPGRPRYYEMGNSPLFGVEDWNCVNRLTVCISTLKNTQVTFGLLILLLGILSE